MRLVTNKLETLLPCSFTWCGFQSMNCDLKCLIYSIIITTVLYLSDALRTNFLNDKFDYKVCSQSVRVVKHQSIWLFSVAQPLNSLFPCRCGIPTSACLLYSSTSPAFSSRPSLPQRGRKYWKSESCKPFEFKLLTIYYAKSSKCQIKWYVWIYKTIIFHNV